MYYRINVLNVEIPSLGNRKEDVIEIGQTIFKKLIGMKYPEYKEFFHELMNGIHDYNWPGNLRELHNFVERISVLLKNNEEKDKIKKFVVEKMQVSQSENNFDHSDNLESWERNHIIYALKKNNLVIAKVSRELGISQSTLYRKMKQYNIKI